MKTATTLLFLIVALNTFGQSAQEYLDAAREKHNVKDYKGALKDYGKAIKSDPGLANAYYNRGTVQLVNGALEDALADFGKAISLDKAFTHAHYSRATVYVTQENYEASLSDLNKAIEINENYPHALTLRGQVHYALKDKEACCMDLEKAKKTGDPDAGTYFTKYCGDKTPAEIEIELKTTVDAYKPTGEEFLEAGVKKHKNKDYQGALEAYTRAIKIDDKLADAYYNRGVVRLATSDLNGSLKDFNKTIEIDNTFIQAYYSRATIYVSQNKFAESLPDLNKVVELNEAFPSALTLRGQIHFALEDKISCCADLTRAKELGDPSADKHFSKYCGNEQQSGESLSLHWPEEENWKIAESQENNQMMMIELLRNDEELYNWTEMGNMQSIKGATGIPMDRAMALIYDEAKQACPKAKLTFIEKDESIEFPWVLFTVECPMYKDTKAIESQLWYIVQGKTSLYTNFRAIKKASIPQATQDKWIRFFKGGKIVYMDGEK